MLWCGNIYYLWVIFNVLWISSVNMGVFFFLDLEIRVRYKIDFRKVVLKRKEKGKLGVE